MEISNNKILIGTILIGLLIVVTGCQAPESSTVSKVERPQRAMVADKSQSVEQQKLMSKR